MAQSACSGKQDLLAEVVEIGASNFFVNSPRKVDFVCIFPLPLSSRFVYGRSGRRLCDHEPQGEQGEQGERETGGRETGGRE